MSDFYQTGIITTLHQIGKSSLERIEGELREFSKSRPIALVLPALYSEFEGPAMPGIVQELAKVKYFARSSWSWTRHRKKISSGSGSFCPRSQPTSRSSTTTGNGSRKYMRPFEERSGSRPAGQGPLRVAGLRLRACPSAVGCHRPP